MQTADVEPDLCETSRGRTTTITLAFTIGHSASLALAALGFSVSTAVIKALTAVGILIAAAHAVRPLFPGKEILVAGFFGLIHGLAFSETLRGLSLTGNRHILSLLGFNLGTGHGAGRGWLGVPPLIVLAAAGRYALLRLTAASAVAIAAVGWLLVQLGEPNSSAVAADSIGAVLFPLTALLWITAAGIFLRAKEKRAKAMAPAQLSPMALPVGTTGN